MDGVSGNYSAAYVTTRFTTGYQSGSLAFRNNAANSLKQSLQHLDNGAVTSASVERRAPSQQLQARWNAVNSAADGTLFQFTNHKNAAVNAPLCVGDIVASNNFDDTPSASNVMGAQQYMYQVQKTITDPASGPGAAKVQVGGPNAWYKGITVPSLISQQADAITSHTPAYPKQFLFLHSFFFYSTCAGTSLGSTPRYFYCTFTCQGGHLFFKKV